MRNAKPYTNATFTKRVDHAGGRHRSSRASAEPAMCPGCGAVYVKRRWALATPYRVLALRANTPVAVRICPTCEQNESGIPHGYLHLDGEFFAEHRADLEALLHNEVDHAREDNPLHQVLDWEDDGTGGLLVATSTEHLAQRLGRALEKAYDGHVHYGFSHENKFSHVWWHR